MLPGSYLKFVPQQFVSDLLLLVCCLTAELREGLDPPVLVLSLKRESSKETASKLLSSPARRTGERRRALLSSEVSSHQKQLHGRSLLPAKASRKPGQRSRAKGRVPSCLINLGWKKNKICLAQDTEASSAACSVYNQESLDIEISSRRKAFCQLLQKEISPWK